MSHAPHTAPVVFIVDDDILVRESLEFLKAESLPDLVSMAAKLRLLPVQRA